MMSYSLGLLLSSKNKLPGNLFSLVSLTTSEAGPLFRSRPIPVISICLSLPSVAHPSLWYVLVGLGEWMMTYWGFWHVVRVPACICSHPKHTGLGFSLVPTTWLNRPHGICSPAQLHCSRFPWMGKTRGRWEVSVIKPQSLHQRATSVPSTQGSTCTGSRSLYSWSFSCPAIGIRWRPRSRHSVGGWWVSLSVLFSFFSFFLSFFF